MLFARLPASVDAEVGRPLRLDLVDMGGRAGRLAALPHETAARIVPCAVERAPASEWLDLRIRSVEPGWAW